MRRNPVRSCIASLLITLVVSMSVTPQLVRAQEIEDVEPLDTTQTEETVSSTDTVSEPTEESTVDTEAGSEESLDTESADEESATADFTDIVQQTTDYTCGPAALATLIALKGGKAEEMPIAELAGATPENGVTLRSLKAAAQTLGYNAKARSSWTVEKLRTADLPVLVHDIQGDGIAHFSVVREVTDDYVALADTSTGNVKLSIEDFSSRFTGNVLTITPASTLDADMSMDAVYNVVSANPELVSSLVDPEGNPLTLEELDELSDEEADQVTGKVIFVLATIPLDYFLIGGIALTGTVIVTSDSLQFSDWITRLAYWFSSTVKKGIDAIVDRTTNPNSDSGCPNPYGSKGGPKHSELVGERGKQLIDEKWTIVAGGGGPEKRVKIQNGYLKHRRPDIWATKNGQTLFENIGKQTKKCQPIKREREALEDLKKAVHSENDGGGPINPIVRFTPYNVIGASFDDDD